MRVLRLFAMLPEHIIQLVRPSIPEPLMKGKELRNRTEVLLALDALIRVPSLENAAADVAKRISLSNDADVGIVQEPDGFIQAIKCLNARRSAIYAFLKNAYPEDAAENLYIQLSPNALGSPQEFSSQFSDIVSQLDHLCRCVTGDGVSVAGVRHGSAWVLVVAESTAALFFIGGLLRFYYWWQTKEHERKMQVEMLATVHTANELIDGIKEKYDDFYRLEMRKMYKQYHTDGTAQLADENLNLGMAYLNTLMSHMNAGAKIVLSHKADGSLRRALPREAGGELEGLPESSQIMIKALKGSAEDNDA